MKAHAIRAWLVAEIARVVGLEPSAIDVRAPFDSLGLSSIDGVTLSGDLEQLLGRDLPPTLVYEHPSIEALSIHLGDSPNAAASVMSRGVYPSQSIAIVGIGCRFPGADGPAAFWRVLRDGTDTIREVPRDRWDAGAYYHPDPAVPGKAASRWGGFLDQIDRFDPFFFGISPGEAERMDPQQRLLMELAFEAFEDAGYPMSRLVGSRTAVLVGVSVNEYGMLQHGRHELLNGHSGTGAALAIGANRISYFFDLHGPSLAVDTACSSSLMAVHLACRSLGSGECDVALAGGVNLVLSPAHSIAFSKAGVLAADGRCKPFDARADGYVRGEGGGLVVLKPLAAALADGDAIYAVIRGGAVFQDGRTNGLMAPNREAQVAVLRAAYENAGVSPGDVQYIETHGTGTLLGDSMEAHAIGQVASAGRRNGACVLGSVKSNLGHLEAAAGAAGLIKVALALKQRAIPPSLHFHSPNPHVPFETLGLRVQQDLSEWPERDGPRLAGVSSFGFGGTNVHLVLEESPPPATHSSIDHGEPQLLPQVLPLSAHGRDALAAVAARFRDFVAATDSEASSDLTQLAANAALRRTHLEHRLAVIARSKAELIERLDLFLRGESHPELLLAGETGSGCRRLAFVFSGQGSQWPGMGRELFGQEPVFRAALEACDAALHPELGWSLLKRVFDEEVETGLDGIDVIQPALFGLQVALASLWRSWGIEPESVVGHSMGEVAAAHVAGGLTLRDAARVVAARSRLLKRLSGQGGMALVGLSAPETRDHFADPQGPVSIAASNGPRSTIVTGELDALDTLVATLERQGVFCRRISVDVAAHGPQAAPLAEDLRRALEHIAPNSGGTPFLSSVTGARLDTGHLGPEYWARNLTQPVNFAGAIEHLLGDEGWDILEISPHPLLQSSVLQGMQHLGRDGSALASLRRGEGERSSLLQSLAALYVSGRAIAWGRLFATRVAPLSLPAYPWQRQRFWLEASSDGQARPAATVPPASGDHPLLGRRIPLAPEPRMQLWECKLEPALEPFLGDHRVNGELVLPGSAFLDLALAAAGRAGIGGSHALVNVEFAHSLVLSTDTPRRLQTILTRAEGEAFSVGIYSAVEGTETPEWTRHVEASLMPRAQGEERTDDPTRLATLRARCAERVGAGEFYQALAGHGLEYGPAMRAVTEAWRGDGEALAHIALPAAAPRRAGGYRIHPVLLDGAMQTLAAARDLAASDPDTTFLPAGCGSLRVAREPGASCWSHVTVRRVGGTEGDLEADVVILDDAGRVVAEIDRLRLARVRKLPRPDSDQGEQDIWLYQLHWKSVRRPDDAPAPASADPAVGRWLILADQHDVAKELVRRLEERGQTCRVLRLDPAPNEIDSAGARNQAIDHLIAAELGAEREAIRGVVGIWCGEPAPTVAQAVGCDSVIALVRGLLAAAGTIGTPRLWLATRGTQAADPGERVVAAHASIWGLGKSIAFELPQLQCTLVDLDPSQNALELSQALAKELLGADAEDQVALRGDRRLVARLLPYRSSVGLGVCAAPHRTELGADASYLITGGLGGLGLTVARWLLDRGARHLMLTGRTPPSAEIARVLDSMREDGADVTFVAADVARADQVERLFRRLREAMPPLRGVVHAAGVLENGPIVALDAEGLSRVMAPKVDGAWNLDQATRDDDLDFFVLFSSAVSVLGSPGQGNYAAANSYLDALAHQRRAEGRAATSINWGPWAEVGLVADDNFIGRRPGAGDRGVKGIDPRHGLEVLDWILMEDLTQLTVLPFDLRSLLDLYPQAARIPLFADVGGRESHVSRLYARPRLRQEYLEPRNDIERRMAEMWRQTLRIDRVGVRDSFFELGGDSVLAAQLVTSAHRAFDVQLDLREAFKAFTIESLAAQIEAALVARLDQMSESDVQRLLQER